MSEPILPATRALYLHLLRSESRSAGYSDAAVRVSVLLDVERSARDGDAVLSQRKYAERWGWTEKTVRVRWADVWRDVAELCLGLGPDHPLVGRLPASVREDALAGRPVRGPGRTKGATGAHEGRSGGAKSSDYESPEPIRGDGRAHEGRIKGATGAHGGPPPSPSPPGPPPSPPPPVHTLSRSNARAHEGPESGPSESVDGWAVDAWRRAFPEAKPLTVHQLNAVRVKARDPAAWAAALERWVQNDHKPHNLTDLFRCHDEQLAELGRPPDRPDARVGDAGGAPAGGGRAVPRDRPGGGPLPPPPRATRYDDHLRG